jgi:peroxiredoxin Q/BCP
MARIILYALGAIGILAFAAGAQQPGLKPGDPAPKFDLPGSDGRMHSLKQLHGQYVVLAWFPKAFTGG